MEKPQILWVAKSYALPEAGVKNHSHPYYHMIYISRGECRLVSGDQTYALRAGQCLLVPRKTDHAYTNEKDTTMEYLEIKFALPKAALDAQLLKRGIRTSDSALIGMLFQQVLKEYSQMNHLADDAATAYLMAILSALGEQERTGQQQSFRYVDASAYSPLSQQIIRYLEEHYAEDLSLDSLARAMGRNKSYLCVAFKNNTQFTILDCLNMIRIRRAAELVVYSEHSLTQVAQMCGFASVSHFNRVFLKYVGITPGQCRRAYPAGLLIGPRNGTSPEVQNNFMYSVLAQKRITPKMIKDLDQLEAEHPISE